MAASDSSRNLRRLRGLLLAALGGLLALIIALFYFGRSRAIEEIPEAMENTSGLAELLLASEGWEYEQTDEGKPVFRIRGEKMLSDSDNNVVLEGVGLTLFRQNGDSWELECNRGSYNTETQKALLQGNVRLVSSTGLTLFTEDIIVEEGGRQVRSTSAVRFQYQALYSGRADRFSINLHSGVYFLDRDVQIDSLPSAPVPTSLRANRLVFEGRRNLVRALGSVRLTHGESQLSAGRLGAYLTADRSQIEFIRARGVQARSSRVSPDGLRETLAVAGATLSVIMDTATDTVRDFELEGGPARRQTEVSIEDSTGTIRQLNARYIAGHGMTPEIQTLNAYEPVLFREFFSFARGSVTAWACADRASITLRANQLTNLSLSGNAEFWRDGIFAQGRSIEFDADGGSTALNGEPARILARRGELEAAAILQIHHSGEIQGHGGIRGRMNRAEAALAGGEEGPIQVEAEEAVWTESPEGLTLKGRVRVWQDEQLLIADEIEENVAQQILEARGGVRTVWTPPEEPEGEGSESGEDGVSFDKGEPIEVTAARAVYDRKNGLVTYSGGSRATQELRSIQGDELELRLSSEGDAEQIESRGNVVIRDPVHKRTVKGDLAVYRPDSGEVRISGERVTLRAEDGTSMVGPVLIYEFDTGRARIESEDLLAIDPSSGDDQ